MKIINVDPDGGAMTVSELDMDKFFAALPAWTMADEIGYEPKTTFWQDFSIADVLEYNGIAPGATIDTFRRAVTEWKDNVTYLTELAMVLNHKGFAWYKRDEGISNLYFRLWQAVDDYAREKLTGDDADYYFRVTD